MTDTPTSDVRYICEVCREKIDPDAPDTVRAVERITTWAIGGKTEQIDGLGVFFHARHYPTASRRYRRVNRPTARPSLSRSATRSSDRTFAPRATSPVRAAGLRRVRR